MTNRMPNPIYATPTTAKIVAAFTALATRAWYDNTNFTNKWPVYVLLGAVCLFSYWWVDRSCLHLATLSQRLGNLISTLSLQALVCLLLSMATTSSMGTVLLMFGVSFVTFSVSMTKELMSESIKFAMLYDMFVKHFSKENK